MGTEVDRTEFSRADRQRFRAKVRDCLDTFARMLAESRFDPSSQAGLEIELNLVDDSGRPAMANTQVLAAIGECRKFGVPMLTMSRSSRATRSSQSS